MTGANHNEFPVYEALSGPLKVFFDEKLNRWVVSDSLDTTDYRAIGSNGSCPDFSNWRVWAEGSFSSPDLENPRVPHINPEQMLECVPEEFNLEAYKQMLIDSMCSKFDRKGGFRLCNKVKLSVNFVFGDWEEAQDSHLGIADVMTARHIETLDQWHQQLVSVLIRRTFFSNADIEKSVRHNIQSTVESIRNSYPNRNFAKKDSRFEYLWI